MGGAGGVIGANYLGEVAKPDGLMMGYFTGTVFHQLLKNPGLRVDFAKYPFISGVQGIRFYQRVTRTPPEVLDFIRQFIEQVRK